jgi:hypothetical protein
VSRNIGPARTSPALSSAHQCVGEEAFGYLETVCRSQGGALRDSSTGKSSLQVFPCGGGWGTGLKNNKLIVGSRLSFFFIFGLFFAEFMDIRVVAKLLQPKIGEKPADLDQLLESMGLRLTWMEKLQLLQLLPGVEAVYHAVSGRILVRRL